MAEVALISFRSPITVDIVSRAIRRFLESGGEASADFSWSVRASHVAYETGAFQQLGSVSLGSLQRALVPPARAFALRPRFVVRHELACGGAAGVLASDASRCGIGRHVAPQSAWHTISSGGRSSSNRGKGRTITRRLHVAWPGFRRIRTIEEGFLPIGRPGPLDPRVSSSGEI